jgi:hypothetical protein
MISLAKRDGHRELNGGGQKNSRKKETFWPKLEEQKPLADWIVTTGVGLLAPGKQDYEEERVERNDGWEPFV